ncbi:hypothetical protein [Virgibacillus salexigens]|uniref:Uncharacterized protein n=2 Tax=Virgibacillus TaxID=84406 RepID=A0A024QHM0_9BACI|nr:MULTISPECIES: hypothetical protein [Virgibacillus]GGJ64926.1 hypothetical protein GCM10007111_28500 [Virgibacillus kapii]CDQ41969.1 hypothetical protein BN990_04348 [Virgibacillus massiliensis]
MAYQLRPYRFHFFSLVLTIICYNYITDHYGWLISIPISFILILILTSIKITLTINEASISYEMSFLHLSIYRKELSPVEISQIKFFRIRWKTKAAEIKRVKGWNWRVADFGKEEVFDYLLDVANKHQIKVDKTKDYLILEKQNQIEEEKGNG